MYEEQNKRVKYRWEFLSRNEVFQEYRERRRKGTGSIGPNPVEKELFHMRMFHPWTQMTKDAESFNEKKLRARYPR